MPAYPSFVGRAEQRQPDLVEEEGLAQISDAAQQWRETRVADAEPAVSSAMDVAAAEVKNQAL